MPAISVDFDGVIHSYDRGWHDGPAGIRYLMSMYPVFILTSRNPKQVARWIEKTSRLQCVHRFPRRKRFWDRQDVLLVTNRKLPAFAYLDDRAVTFTDWDAILSNPPRPGRV